MTEISTIKSGAQVVNLKPQNVREPEKVGSIDRFSEEKVEPSGEAGPAPIAKPATLDKGQDPLDQAAKAIDEFIVETGGSTTLRIDQDDDTGRFIYKSIDSESGEVVRQFPPETILQIISKFREPEGLVVDDEA